MQIYTVNSGSFIEDAHNSYDVKLYSNNTNMFTYLMYKDDTPFIRILNDNNFVSESEISQEDAEHLKKVFTTLHTFTVYEIEFSYDKWQVRDYGNEMYRAHRVSEYMADDEPIIDKAFQPYWLGKYLGNI